MRPILMKHSFHRVCSPGDYDASAHRARILGAHVGSYMQTLLDEDEDAYKRQFAVYKKEGIMPDMIEEMYTKVNTFRHKRSDLRP